MSRQLEQMPTILLLENDDETRRLLVDNLRDRGYQIVVAVDEENAIEWLMNKNQINIALILVNQVKVSRQECVAQVRRIYEQTELSPAIPNVIIAEQYQATLAGTEEKINDNSYIIYLENAQQLFDFIYQLVV
jgi:CheY-like chemotaxis protein